MWNCSECIVRLNCYGCALWSHGGRYSGSLIETVGDNSDVRLCIPSTAFLICNTAFSFLQSKLVWYVSVGIYLCEHVCMLAGHRQ